jgi:hypothetical protein
MKAILGMLTLGSMGLVLYLFWTGSVGGCNGVVDCIGYGIPVLAVTGVGGYLGYRLLKD